MTATTTRTPQPPAEKPDPVSLESLVAQITANSSTITSGIDWAEEEIALAARRHPQQADLLHHSFSLLPLRIPSPAASTEFVCRGHARELLDRVATGANTRLATAAEICLMTTEVAKATPLHGAAFGLHLRLWLQAFPNNLIFDDQADQLIHYEKLRGSRIDDLEQDCRHRLGDTTRVLGTISCHGRHHSVPVRCRFAT